MATAPAGKAGKEEPRADEPRSGGPRPGEPRPGEPRPGEPRPDEPRAEVTNLEAEIARLREDVARLTEQLSRTGEHTMAAARRAAAEGAEQLRVKGEAAVDALKSNANDLERQVTDAVREKPITSLAIAAGIGFFFALLSRR